MATEGLPVKLACRVLKGFGVGLPRKTLTATLCAICPARMADRLDPSSTFRLARHLWHSTSSCRTDVGASCPGRAPSGGAADASSRHPGHLGATKVPPSSRGHYRGRPC